MGASIAEDPATNDEVLTLQSMFQKFLQERQKTDSLITQAGVSFESMVRSEVSIRYILFLKIDGDNSAMSLYLPQLLISHHKKKIRLLLKKHRRKSMQLDVKNLELFTHSATKLKNLMRLLLSSAKPAVDMKTKH